MFATRVLEKFEGQIALNFFVVIVAESYVLYIVF